MQTSDPAYSRQLIRQHAQQKNPELFYKQKDILMSVAHEHVTDTTGDLVYTETEVQISLGE